MKQFEVKRKQIEYLSMFFEIVILWVIAHKVGMEGMGFFLIAWILYVILWAVLAESFPDALGRMIRFRKSKGQFRSVRNLKRMALVWQTGLGIFGCVLLLATGEILSERVFHSSYSKLMIWILAPLVLFRSISALLLGLTQGEGTELPAVVACVLRPLMTYGLGLLFGELFGIYGEKVSLLLKQERYTAMYTGAGWCLAMTAAEAGVLLLTLLEYLGVRRKMKRQESEGLKSYDSNGQLLLSLYGNMGGKILIRILELFPVVAGMAVFSSRDQDNAAAGFGSYFVGYLSICMGVALLLHSMTIPFWGKIAGLLRRDEKRLARVCFQGGMHLHVSLGFWLAVSVSVMAAPLGELVGFTSPKLVKILSTGSFLILFTALSFYFSRMLMRLGKGMIAIGMGVLCDVLFLMIFLILWSNENMGISALMYASLITAGVYAVLLGALCIQLLEVPLDWLNVFVIPLVLGAVTGFLESLAVKFLGAHLGNLLTVVSVGGAGLLILLCGLLLLRNFNEEELSVIPSGGLLHSLGSMLGVF